jgi:methylated-DNA-protein-cysteine methyltransferase-like protein
MSKFKDKIIQIVRLIPKGKVASYGQVALIAGYPRGARQVGWILHVAGGENGTPWWRVINNKGRISTKCLEHNPNIQKQMLEEDGIIVAKNLDIDIEKYRWRTSIKELKKLKLDDEYIFRIQEKYGI